MKMKKKQCIKCKISIEKYRKYIFNKTVLSIVCDACDSNDKKVFKEKESIDILNILGSINNMNEYYLSHQMNIL